mmetsp:Transcript_32523/g.59038  ORF Transcript_32523/g.59038 Transcript_32523/m.59038 type:complete len:547 (-) Transcript_32523:518-2158(-)
MSFSEDSSTDSESVDKDQEEVTVKLAGDAEKEIISPEYKYNVKHRDSKYFNFNGSSNIMSKEMSYNSRKIYLLWVDINLPISNPQTRIHNLLLHQIIEKGSMDDYGNSKRFSISKVDLQLFASNTFPGKLADLEAALKLRYDLYGIVTTNMETPMVVFIGRPFESKPVYPVVYYESTPSRPAKTWELLEILTKHAEHARFIVLSAKKVSNTSFIIQILVPDASENDDFEDKKLRRHVDLILQRAGQSKSHQTSVITEESKCDGNNNANCETEGMKFSETVYVMQIHVNDSLASLALRHLFESPRILKVIFNVEDVVSSLCMVKSIERLFPVLDLQVLVGLDDLPRSAVTLQSVDDSKSKIKQQPTHQLDTRVFEWIGNISNLYDASQWYGVIEENDKHFAYLFQEIKSLQKWHNKLKGSKERSEPFPESLTSCSAFQREALSEEVVIILHLFHSLVSFEAPVQLATKLSQAAIDYLLGYLNVTNDTDEWVRKASMQLASNGEEDNPGDFSFSKKPVSWLSAIFEETMKEMANRAGQCSIYESKSQR